MSTQHFADFDRQQQQTEDGARADAEWARGRQSDAALIAQLRLIQAGMEETRRAMGLAGTEISRLRSENERKTAALRQLVEEFMDRYDGAPDAGLTAVWIGSLITIAQAGLGESL